MNETESCRLIIIGGSAGALEAIIRFLPEVKLSGKISIIIVLHRKKDSVSGLDAVLQSKTNWTVKEAMDKENILNGFIYLAPQDYHLLVERNCTFSLDAAEKINFSRPSIDATFESAAMALGHDACCILLSGANADGGAGIAIAAKSGARTAVQDPESAAVKYMPQNALKLSPGLQKLSPDEMAGFINSF